LVPVREEAMSAYEIMLSESQERMLIILKPEAENKAREIFHRWGLDFAVIGELTETGHLEIIKNGKIEANIPIDPMVDGSPEYDRPWEPTPLSEPINFNEFTPKDSIIETLKTLISCPDLASRRWIWEQFDHLIMNNTIVRPGGDAAVIRVPKSNKALAMTVDCTPRYCLADPESGGAQAVAEAWRNITATGAQPLALTNNMNFGNPERPRIMGQFVGCIKGMRDAALALDFPVVSGNVSLYNETDGKAILPTPVIGGVGILENETHHATIDIKNSDESLVVIGNAIGWLGQSLYLREIFSLETGAPPPVNLTEEKLNGDFVRQLIANKQVTASHDISDGGLLVALVEMAFSAFVKGNIFGIEVIKNLDLPPHAFYFGEEQARYIVTTNNLDKLKKTAEKAGVNISIIGKTTLNGQLILEDNCSIAIEELYKEYDKWLPEYMLGA
jgi:phosphoribosylformylglycinamidine synthase